MWNQDEDQLTIELVSWDLMNHNPSISATSSFSEDEFMEYETAVDVCEG